jgi:hypothetical protein
VSSDKKRHKNDAPKEAEERGGDVAVTLFKIEHSLSDSIFGQGQGAQGTTRRRTTRYAAQGSPPSNAEIGQKANCPMVKK